MKEIRAAIKKHLPKIAEKVERNMGMTEQEIDLLGGPERARVILSVVDRATAQALNGGGSFGYCVSLAEEELGVKLTTRERKRVVLATARASLAIGRD